MKDLRLYTTSADYVYQELRHKIITKKMKPGQRLPEVNIAAQMGVSRTPVREALRRLSSEGLVLIIPNSGARLVAPSRKEMRHAYLVRERLECLAVELAVDNMAEKYLRRLEETILLEERAFMEKNLEQYLEINESFHRIIAEATGNKLLIEYIENILARTNIFIVFYDPFYDIDTNPSIEEHRKILKAFREGDKERSIALMRDHLKESQDVLEDPEKE